MPAFVLISLALVASVDPGLRPDTVLEPPGGPAIAVFEAGSSDVVSIRVSVPLAEDPGEAGAGQLLRIQARDRMESLAARVGARVEVHRTPLALVYQVTGAAQDLDFLTWILREGMAPPDPVRFETARREAFEELERRRETPEGTLALRMRDSLAPGVAPLQGSRGSLDRLNPSRLSALWARSHHRPHVRIVVAGRIAPTVLLTSLSELGLPEEAPHPTFPPVQLTGEPVPSPEVIRHWVARGYRLDGSSGAAVWVTARHMSRVLQESPGDYEAAVELWELQTGRALVISGAAYDWSRQAMRNRVAELVGEGLQRLDEERARQTARELIAELRRAARHPWGLADLVGQAWDAGEGPDGAARLIEELQSVGAAEVRALLERLADATPVQEEIRP